MGVRAKCRECGFTWTRDAWQHCSVCHATLASTDAGDGHRIGSYTDPADPRRCRTPDELAAGGMWQTGDGVWHGVWRKDGKQRRWSGPIQPVGPPSEGAESPSASPRQGGALDATETAVRGDAA